MDDLKPGFLNARQSGFGIGGLLLETQAGGRRHSDGGVIAVTMIASTSLMLRLRCGIVLF